MRSIFGALVPTFSYVVCLHCETTWHITVFDRLILGFLGAS